MKKIIQWFTIWRLLLFIPVFIGIVSLPFRENSLFTTLWQYTDKYPVVENELIYPWSNFDGVHYIGIASRWYVDDGRFMPLFPIIVGVVAAPLSLIWPVLPYGPATFWAGILVSTVATILALYYLTKLLHLDYKTKTIQTTIFLTLASPLAFFFAAIYTEGLFLLLSILALYFARQKKWFLASLAAMFLSVTRLSGILIIFPLLWEYYELKIKPKNNFGDILTSFWNSLWNSKKQLFGLDNKIWKKYKNLFWFAIIPILLILYSYFNYLKWGDFLFFINAHGKLGNSRETTNIVFPLITVYRYVKIFLTVSIKQYEFWIALLEFGALIYASWSLFLAWKEKIRPSYQIFALVMISLPLLSGTLSGFPRYILPIFPFFLAQGLWFNIHKKNKHSLLFLVVFVGISILLQALLLMLFARGYYVS